MKCNYNDINPSDIQLKKYKKGNMQLLNGDSNIIEFQTPIVTIELIKKDDKDNLILVLSIPNDFREFMGSIQERLNIKFKNFSDYLGSELMVKTTNKTMGFTKTKEFISTSELKEGDDIIMILTTTGTWTDKVSTNLVWTVKQFVKL